MDEALTLREYGGSQTVEDARFLRNIVKYAPNNTWVEVGSKHGTSTYIIGKQAQARGGRLYCYEPKPRISWVWNMLRAHLMDAVVLIEEASPPRSPILFETAPRTQTS